MPLRFLPAHNRYRLSFDHEVRSGSDWPRVESCLSVHEWGWGKLFCVFSREV